jgi:lipopolysaccharide transport system ATP-binding protein
MGDIAIHVEDIGKMYRIGGQVVKYRTLRDTISENLSTTFRHITTGSKAKEEIWALRHIDFEVQKGHLLGIVGRNGAGKSTLLKILARVTHPTEGFAEIHGRVGSLLEVGTGFHPELTGRENIFLNGAILGMKKYEIDRKFDEIVSFSEVEKFIDTPVKRYSSGMYLRLAFAVAAHLEPEILVVDEVLAVGDAEFQRKCLGKMSDVAREGRTVLFVSHNMSAILRLTEEALVIEKGRIVYSGVSQEAVDYYLAHDYDKGGEHIWRPDELSSAASEFKPIAIRIRNSRGQASETLRSTESATIEVEYQLKKDIQGLRVGIYLITTRGEFILTSFDTDEPQVYEKHTIRKAGHYTSSCAIPKDFLNEGRFVVGVNASSYKIKRYFHDEQALVFNVNATNAPGMQWPENRLGPIRPRLEWRIEEVH